MLEAGLIFPSLSPVCPQVKSFEKERQSEKRIPESDLVDHIVQKCRTKFYEEKNVR